LKSKAKGFHSFIHSFIHSFNKIWDTKNSSDFPMCNFTIILHMFCQLINLFILSF
jgi:hypothetical protein